MMRLKGSSLYQWETGRKMLVDSADKVKAVYFSNSGDKDALTVTPEDDNGNIVAVIPDALLQSGKNLVVYSSCESDGGVKTVFNGIFTVRPRPKPADYVYTE